MSGLKFQFQFSTHFLSNTHKKALANVGPKGKHIPTPSTCLYYMLMKIDIDSSIAKSNNVLNSTFERLWRVGLFRSASSTDMFMVSVKGILVKKEWISKLVIITCWWNLISEISLTNWVEFYIIYSLLVIGVKIGTKKICKIIIKYSYSGKYGYNWATPRVNFGQAI